MGVPNLMSFKQFGIARNPFGPDSGQMHPSYPRRPECSVRSTLAKKDTKTMRKCPAANERTTRTPRKKHHQGDTFCKQLSREMCATNM